MHTSVVIPAPWRGALESAETSMACSVQGNFTGTVFRDNSVDCGNGRCHYGIEVGPRPYYVSANVFGGTITANTVTGAGILINVDGGGTAADPVVVVSNSLG